MTTPLATIRDYETVGREARDYNDVMVAFRDRLDEIKLAMTMLDELSGMPADYAGKVLGASRMKKLGFLSFFLYAEVLALKIVLVPDVEAAKRMEGRWEKRDELRRRPGVIRHTISPEVVSKVAAETGRLGGIKPKAFRLSPDQRRRINKRNGKKGGRPRKLSSPPSIKSQSSQSFGMP